jgi:hypothetical protein
MGKRRIIFFRLLVCLLFVFACDDSLPDTVREDDFFSGNEYEQRDIEDLYAEKGSNLDGALVSPTLFSPLPDTLFKFLPSSFSPDTLLVTTPSILRC